MITLYLVPFFALSVNDTTPLLSTLILEFLALYFTLPFCAPMFFYLTVMLALVASSLSGFQEIVTLGSAFSITSLTTSDSAAV